MVYNDDFDGKATDLSCFYLHINFEQKYPKPAIVYSSNTVLRLVSFFAEQTLNYKNGETVVVNE